MNMILSPYQFAVAGPPPVEKLIVNSVSNGSGAFSVDISSLQVQAGHVVLVAVAHVNGGTNYATPPCTANVSGAVTNDTDLYGNDSADINLWTYHYKATGADTTLNFTGGVNTKTYIVDVRVYRNIDATTQLDVAVVSATGFDLDLPNPPAVTPVTDYTKIISYYATARTNSGGTWTGPQNLSDKQELKTQTNTSTDWCHLLSAHTSGNNGIVFDPVAVGGGVGGGSNFLCSWAAVTYVLRQVTGTLGSELATNTWTGAGGWTYNSGTDVITGASATQNATLAGVFVSGKTYKIVMPINKTAGSKLRFRGSNAGTDLYITPVLSNGSQTLTFYVTADGTELDIQADTAVYSGTIGPGISIKEVT